MWCWLGLVACDALHASRRALRVAAMVVPGREVCKARHAYRRTGGLFIRFQQATRRRR